MKASYFLFVLCMFTISGCAGLSGYQGCDAETEKNLVILHPAAFRVELISNQQVSITTSEQTFEFLAQLEVSHEKLVLVALTPIGQKLFQIQYRPGQMDFERFGIPDTFDPFYLLADISMIYADEKTLAGCYRQTDLVVPVIEQVKLQRRVGFPGQQPLVISYSNHDKWQSDIVFNNPNRNYEIAIRSLQVEALGVKHQ